MGCFSRRFGKSLIISLVLTLGMLLMPVSTELHAQNNVAALIDSETAEELIGLYNIQQENASEMLQVTTNSENYGANPLAPAFNLLATLRIVATQFRISLVQNQLAAAVAGEEVFVEDIEGTTDFIVFAWSSVLLTILANEANGLLNVIAIPRYTEARNRAMEAAERAKMREMELNCILDRTLEENFEDPEASCEDGVDNDCDFQADCSDTDCANDVACGGPGPVCGNGVIEEGEECEAQASPNGCEDLANAFCNTDTCTCETLNDGPF